VASILGGEAIIYLSPNDSQPQTLALKKIISASSRDEQEE
jgi:hypothetical protein